ncbi:MAG TPA: hypothetical protein VF074_01390 [Pyrinomonadaceae bacterium]
MRQLGVQRGFFETPREFVLNTDSEAVDLNHLLMLAIERALGPPIVHRRSTFQPMRVVIVDRELVSRVDSNGEPGAMPRVLPNALHHAAQISSHIGYPLQQRAVRGEILSDEGGRLFEKLGRQIRPLHQLASGPFGEVIDLVPAPKSSLPANAPTLQPRPVASSETTNTLAENQTKGANDETVPAQFVPVTDSTKQTSTISHRKLFADPGQWRVLSWGEFKEILSPQLAHPERLRDTYRLPCYVQVLETERAVSISELAGVYKSEIGRPARLYFLTDEIAAKLDLVLPLRAAPPQNVQRPPNTLLAHERVFRLIVANDPTIDIANNGSNLPVSVSKRESNAEVKGSESASTTTTLKDTIPSRFVKEWEFKISRDEALYDMNVPSTLGKSILKICGRLRVGKHRREFSKWQALLTGKDIDEQLWAVRPPKDRLTDLSVREWARKTLDLGGYESQKMINEWEIFWRRRGR